MKKELLSPAGSIDVLKQAIHNGCDAVYLGGKRFGARMFASNFDDEEMVQAIKYCHLYGVKIYVTVNTMIYENELDEIMEENHPQKAGIWIYEKDRKNFLDLLKNITKSEYEITSDVYLKIVDIKNTNENDKKIQKIINGDKLFVIRISSICYIIDDITGEILDYNFEQIDEYQTYEYFKDEDKMIIFITQNKEKQLEEKEIIQSIIDLM